jgi:hypothetical protein
LRTVDRGQSGSDDCTAGRTAQQRRQSLNYRALCRTEILLFLGSAALDQVRWLGCIHARTNNEHMRNSPKFLNCECVKFAPHVGPQTFKLRLPTAHDAPIHKSVKRAAIPCPRLVLSFISTVRLGRYVVQTQNETPLRICEVVRQIRTAC